MSGIARYSYRNLPVFSDEETGERDMDGGWYCLALHHLAALEERDARIAELEARANDFDEEFVCPECKSIDVEEYHHADDHSSMKCRSCSYVGSPGEDFPTIVAIHRTLALRDAEVARLEGAKDGAYSERNMLVALLSSCFPSQLQRHPDADETWEDDWRWIVFVELPAGQASWHIHDSELKQFGHLRRDLPEIEWDGHTNDEKYARVLGSMYEDVLSDPPSQLTTARRSGIEACRPYLEIIEKAESAPKMDSSGTPRVRFRDHEGRAELPQRKPAAWWNELRALLRDGGSE